jgi:hypothetical protein
VELGRSGRPCEWWRRRSGHRSVEHTEVAMAAGCGLQPGGHGASAVILPSLLRFSPAAPTCAKEETDRLGRQPGRL